MVAWHRIVVALLVLQLAVSPLLHGSLQAQEQTAEDRARALRRERRHERRRAASTENEAPPAVATAPLEVHPAASVPSPVPPTAPIVAPVALPLAPTEPTPVANELIDPPTQLANGFVALRAGVLLPQMLNPLETNFTVALELGWFLPIANQQLALVVGANYTQPERHESRMDPRLASGSYRYSIVQRNLGAYLGLQYFFANPLTDTWIPYVGAGARAHFLWTEANGFADAATFLGNTEFSLKCGGALRAGLALNLHAGALTLDAELDLTPIDHVTTGQYNVGSLAVSLGYLYAF